MAGVAATALDTDDMNKNDEDGDENATNMECSNKAVVGEGTPSRA